MAGQVEIDVVLVEQRQVDEARGRTEGNDDHEQPDDHVRGQAQNVPGSDGGERERTARRQGHAVRLREGDRHQARHLERRDGKDQRSADEDRGDADARGGQETENVDVGDHSRRRARSHPVKEPARPGREERERQDFEGEVGGGEDSPRPKKIPSR